MLSVIFFLRLIIHTSTVFYRLKTIIQVILLVVHFHFTALFAHNFCSIRIIYMRVELLEYRIFAANYVRLSLGHNGKRTLIYKKNIALCWHSSVMNDINASTWHLAYSASFPPCRVAFSTWRGRKDGWNDMRRSVKKDFPATAMCDFYRRDAMLTRVFATATCPSVCPSRAGIVSKRRKSRFIHHKLLSLTKPVESQIEARGIYRSRGPRGLFHPW